MKDMCYEVRRAEACVSCVFITFLSGRSRVVKSLPRCRKQTCYTRRGARSAWWCDDGWRGQGKAVKIRRGREQKLVGPLRTRLRMRFGFSQVCLADVRASMRSRGHAPTAPLRLGEPCPAVHTVFSSRAAAPDPGHTQNAAAASPAPERAGGLDLLGLLPPSLLSFSLPSSGKQQQGWRLDNPPDKQDAAQAHDWTAAVSRGTRSRSCAPCSRH